MLEQEINDVIEALENAVRRLDLVFWKTSGDKCAIRWGRRALDRYSAELRRAQALQSEGNLSEAIEREAFMRAAQEVRSFLADEPLEAFTRLPEAIESLADRDWRSEEEA